MKGKKLLCAVSAWILSVSLIPGAVFGAQEDPGSQTIDPGRIIGTVMEQAQKMKSVLCSGTKLSFVWVPFK